MDSNKAKDMFEGQAHLYRLMFNFITSMGLKAAIELGIADVIHNHGQPITISELVLALHINPARTSFFYRLMRLLTHSGLFVKTKVKEEEEEGYDLTPCSKLLLKHNNVPNLSSIVKVALEPPLSQPFQALGEWFQRDDDGVKVVTPFEAVFGKGFWQYGNENPEFANLFNEAMRSDSGMMNLVIKGWRDVFEGVNSLVDAGGGVGETARIISEEFPNIKCTVLDLPHVVSGLEDGENLKFIGGDMLQSIPSADAILFKNVLTGKSDEDCVKVLKKCREAITENGKKGKVIIMDIVINERDMHDLTQTKLYFDLLMMIITAGREREEREWEKLFMEAGFSRYHITPIFGLRSLIQVYP
ncbi:trans-resveratrol di-O-methyltransferase-like [Senna tora]|uniref:isoflavone 7-O-methyltransferase n=1 Tax=Senna tora TaxID=362788 RepID=A0A834SGY3_9FABA|nr:trans-resveratrol di-O-methyltransferase-like [Senna tora]